MMRTAAWPIKEQTDVKPINHTTIRQMARYLGLAVLLTMGVSLDAHAAITDIPAGTASLDAFIGENCFLYSLGDSFCSVAGACATNAHIDSGASAVGKAVGNGPMVTGQGFNAFNRYFGLLNGTKRVWIQVGAPGAGQCKVLSGAANDGAITVGTRSVPSSTPGVDLVTTLSMPSTANKGDKVTFTISVTNKGATAATNVHTRFIRPVGLTGSGNSSSGVSGCGASQDGTNTVIDCPFGSFGSGETKTWSYNIYPASPTVATNIITADCRAVDQTDAIPANNSVSKQLVFSGFPPAPSSTAGVDLETTISAPQLVNKGDTITMTITVTNRGGTTATNVRSVVVRPLSLTATSSGLDSVTGCTSTSTGTVKDLNCPLGSLAPGASKQWQQTLDGASATYSPNTITASCKADQTDDITANNTASTQIAFNGVTTPPPPPPAAPAHDLAVAVTGGPTTFKVGTNLAFTITLTNRGTSAASNVKATLLLRDGMVLTSHSNINVSSCTTGLSGVGYDICRFGTLAPGTSVSYAVALSTSKVVLGTRLYLSATAEMTESDANTINNQKAVDLTATAP